ncbi:PspC domain-containing protein [Tamlana sp. 2_MG-2023]|uniref:PspC domain-containing protein n=1 Tax=unclassified Tamlana TaxID=2614803 RepID=UPI0026E33A4F|nr:MULTISPECIES: PspC domain-containing protein [unclassified Tamlana]MDO6760353.1 PspC domain-containing protein [Tamlana sp. 2_MG-2023]MDO6789949.1 PspC domain-containing protein [Tamlana sp. 1_MG-2023]
MNKTVNINLAGIFFHIDEDAYLKLQGYLEAIKRSLANSQGSDEIIADIEARIAELFNERVQNNKQVIRIKEVDEVISIMGQPEDYVVDDEMFEDEPDTSYKQKSTTKRKLFRDADNAYISGVSSGLAHYFGIDAVWVRLAWILLVFGAGTGVLLYILLWILVPEAKTTAEKIMMTGEPVNISNIEKKIKDGFENVSQAAKNVSDSVSKAAKNVDIKKGTNSIKSTSRTFFDSLADAVMLLFKVFSKFIGILLIFIGASTLIALIIALFSVGVADIIHIPGFENLDILNVGNTPIWLVSLSVFFAVGIPFFFLFYLGLKILINNLKSIGNIAKFTLLGLWIISIICLIIFGIRQASEHAFNESYIEKTELPVTANDTLIVKMVHSHKFNSKRRHDDFKLTHDDNGNKILYSADIRIMVKSTTDTIATLAVIKNADGRSFDAAISRAKNIDYHFDFKNNTLLLNSYLTTHIKNKFSDQEVDIILYLPENTVVYFNSNTEDYIHYRTHDGHLVSNKSTNHFIKILDNNSKCLDCPDSEEDFNIEVNTPEIKIDSNGIKVESDEIKININSNGIDIQSDR